MLVHRRITVRCGTAAAGALIALLLPPLGAGPASAAGPTARVAFEPLGHSGTGAAGACLLYRMVAQDAAFEESITEPGQAFANVTLTEGGDAESQDVDFCSIDGKGDVFKRAPRYYNSGNGTNGTPLYYNPGWTLTPEEAGNPDKARQDVPPATSSAPVGRPDKAAKDPSTSSAGANNYLSLDQAIVGYDPEAGGFVFGVVSGTAAPAELSGYLDHNGDGIESPEITGVSPADVRATPATVSFTPGGAPYSLAAADAVRSLVASPKSVTAIAGDASGASLLAAVTNAEGQPLVGVRPRLAAEGGPNATSEAPTWAGSCAASDSRGRAACTYTGQLPGTDQVAIFVNQTTSGGTASRDATEPFDVVEVTLSRTQAAPSPSASPSPTPAATEAPADPTPPAEPQCLGTAVALERHLITATEGARLVVHSTPERAVRLLAYSRPSTTYRTVREAVTGADGTVAFTVRPLTSTRLYAEESGCPASVSEVLQVRSALSLGARRVGVREFVFSGRVIPARPGQLVSLYRLTSSGRQVLAAQVRVGKDGLWNLRRSFTGTGRFGFVARTGADMVNAAGSSSVRVVDIR